jgi:hypothetical protein
MPCYIYIAENTDLYKLYPKDVVVKIGITEKTREYRENTLNGKLDHGSKYAEYKNDAIVLSAEWAINPENYKQVSSPIAEKVIHDSVVNDGGRQITGHYRIQNGRCKTSIELFSIPHKGRFVFTNIRRPVFNTQKLYLGGGPTTKTNYEIISFREDRDFAGDVTDFFQLIIKRIQESKIQMP